MKLKEISYIHAEGYPAAEMKHGPIALIDEEMPVVVVSPKLKTYEKIVSNVQEIKARKGKIIAIVTKGDVDIKRWRTSASRFRHRKVPNAASYVITFSSFPTILQP